MRTDPPPDVPTELWRWTCAQLGDEQASELTPSVAIMLATRRSEIVPDRMLMWWAWFLDGERRLVDQNELHFIECARESGQTDEQIKQAILLEAADNPDARMSQLNARIHRTARPPGVV